jgi:hypothetical protein
MVQRHAARYVLHNYTRTASVTAMLLQLKWELLKFRRIKLRLTLMYKIMNNLVDISREPYFQPAFGHTRSQNNLKIRQLPTTKSYHQASFFINTIPHWNIAPASVVSAPTLDSFRGALASYEM